MFANKTEQINSKLMFQHPKILNDVIALAAEHKAQNKAPLKAIFDLDSTLFDVSHRITKIFHIFAELKEIKEKYPDAAKQLLSLAPMASDYGVKKTLMRINFKSPGDEFLKQLVEFWKKQFFSSDFLNIDVPYPGAQEFVSHFTKQELRFCILPGGMFREC